MGRLIGCGVPASVSAEPDDQHRPLRMARDLVRDVTLDDLADLLEQLTTQAIPDEEEQA